MTKTEVDFITALKKMTDETIEALINSSDQHTMVRCQERIRTLREIRATYEIMLDEWDRS